MKDKNFVKTPPLGWNSWDCFGAAVNEKELMKNAEYMEKNLKQFGWEYIVCDIQWYEPTADSTEYHDFVPLKMDEYSRLVPAEERFPSAANGKGFKPIADKIHKMGLKFGIHIMRGIPRQAVHENTPIKNSTATARQIAQRFSVCSWNTDMYGVDANSYGAQAYYNSLLELYASWGVDFIKVDDICNTYFKKDDLYSAHAEIELIRHAIDNCGRDIVLSLSPGPADINRVEHLSKNANMWRISADFWDRWDDLNKMFDLCNKWAPYVKEGCFPDCDMIPFGHLSIKGDAHGRKDRMSMFTKEEQKTLMTLWCIFRSPLMLGGHLPDNDEYTLKLITNAQVMELNQHSHGAHQVTKNGQNGMNIVWESYGENGEVYVAMFNRFVIARHMEVTLDELGIEGKYKAYDLWDTQVYEVTDKTVHAIVEPHGAVLLKLEKIK